MATLEQMKTLSGMDMSSWEHVDIYSNTSDDQVPIPGRSIFHNGQGRIVQVMPDGAIRNLVPDEAHG